MLRFEDGTRAKIKYAEYVRLHKLLTGINARDIWEMLVKQEPIAPLLERVPDEFYAWIMETVSGLLYQYDDIERQSRAGAASVMHLESRKEIAAMVKNFSYPAVVFKMLDGKDYRDTIWKLLKPSAEKPFTAQEGA